MNWHNTKLLHNHFHLVQFNCCHQCLEAEQVKAGEFMKKETFKARLYNALYVTSLLFSGENEDSDKVDYVHFGG